MRKSIVAGNWKMNGNQESIRGLLSGLVENCKKDERVDIVVCPPALYLQQVSESVAGSAVRVGAQNVSQFESGAYTGEVALQMLKEFSCEYVILGHSERRAIFGEIDQQVAEKFVAAVEQGVKPILCVGETLEEREAGRTLSVVASQVQAVIEYAGIERFADAVIAYEPVWAIGTGKTATPAQAQEVHAAIRSLVAEADKNIAATLPLLYGGSVNAANAAELFAQADIDGGLVGGASLKIDEFVAICSAAADV